MDASVETFKAATAEFEDASKAATALASDLKQVGSSMSYSLNTFLELNYALAPQQRPRLTKQHWSVST